jgi:hypothetical protein
MLYNLQLKTRHGNELLDELASVLSKLYSFNSEGDLDFVSTIILLRRYWDEVRGHLDKGKTECRSEFIRILKKMAILHGKTNIPVACAARVIACHVESSYLNDEEARLVQCITSIHIDRAATSGQCCLTWQDRRNWPPDHAHPHAAFRRARVAPPGDSAVLYAPRAAITLAALLHFGQPATRDLAAFHRAA